VSSSFVEGYGCRLPVRPPATAQQAVEEFETTVARYSGLTPLVFGIIDLMPSIVTFTYSEHAKAMLAERNIEPSWVERTILQPDVTEPDPKHPDRLRAFRTVPERDGRVLRVVYVSSGAAFRVITLFLDRGRKR